MTRHALVFDAVACCLRVRTNEDGSHEAGPATGVGLHVTAPYKVEDGTVHGPYHHSCKQVKTEIFTAYCLSRPSRTHC
ncbi:hypothetical protein YTPLAS18_34240 [Nitrospira sp.]|nr:hypothetical protein YTPLAS18_34240 [Nitrospira sp.]